MPKRIVRPQNLLTSESDYVDIEHEDGGSIGDDISTKVTTIYGSWNFFWIQTGIIAFWFIFNTIAFSFISHWDIYPFVFMNLCLSLEAGYSGIFILMSSNRAAKREEALSAQVRHTTNRAWSNTERIEQLTELILEDLAENKVSRQNSLDNITQLFEAAHLHREISAQAVLDRVQASDEHSKEVLRLIQERQNATARAIKEFQDHLDEALAKLKE